MKLATALIASILSLTTFDATAAAPTDAISITVEYGDLNLDHQAGIATLYRRIKGAARQICGEQTKEQVVSKQIYRACVKQAVSTAVTRMGRPMLSDYVAQLGGKHVKTAPESVAAR